MTSAKVGNSLDSYLNIALDDKVDVAPHGVLVVGVRVMPVCGLLRKLSK